MGKAFVEEINKCTNYEGKAINCIVDNNGRWLGFRA